MAEAGSVAEKVKQQDLAGGFAAVGDEE